MSLKRKFTYTLLMFTFFSFGYFLIQRLVDSSDISLLVEIDKAIPLMPEFVWIYHSLPLLIVLVMVVLIKRADIFWRTFCSCALSSTIMLLCFVALPIEYPRPEISSTDISSLLLVATHKLDYGGLNTCPSGHVAFACLMFLAAVRTQWVRREPWMGRVFLLWTIGIMLSTLVLKQHFIADVLAGVFLAAFSFYASKFVVKRAPAAN